MEFQYAPSHPGQLGSFPGSTVLDGETKKGQELYTPPRTQGEEDARPSAPDRLSVSGPAANEAWY